MGNCLATPSKGTREYNLQIPGWVLGLESTLLFANSRCMSVLDQKCADASGESPPNEKREPLTTLQAGSDRGSAATDATEASSTPAPIMAGPVVVPVRVFRDDMVRLFTPQSLCPPALRRTSRSRAQNSSGFQFETCLSIN